ncbi:MAG: hypothetical protein AB8B65_11435 [Kordia sp.]|uniref:hypothetical protein n=1 Tax=Kordia sp. TaxID=1965332 RepID=UPI00385C6881
MKTKRKLLTFNKTRIAKINSYNIIGKGRQTDIDCAAEESRTPKGGATQSTSNNVYCTTSV